MCNYRNRTEFSDLSIIVVYSIFARVFIIERSATKGTLEGLNVLQRGQTLSCDSQINSVVMQPVRSQRYSKHASATKELLLETVFYSVRAKGL
jgi:hypothetical protein